QKKGAPRAAVRLGLYPFAGPRDTALYFVNTASIMLLLCMLGIAAGLFFRVSKVKRERISLRI
ncbi:MAG: hypothetical protein ACE5I8_09720, partial [Thermodesulfobacteriota bacterium]